MALFERDDDQAESSTGNQDDDQLFELRYPEGDEEGEPELYVPEDALRKTLARGDSHGTDLSGTIDERTVAVNEELDEDAFFSTVEGHTTVTNRYDLEKAVPADKKTHFEERGRYWVNKPYAFVTIFHSTRENETKYYLIEPYLTPIEKDLREFLTEKLRTAIKYQSDEVLVEEGADKAAVIERETRRLLERYDLYETSKKGGILSGFGSVFGSNGNGSGTAGRSEPNDGAEATPSEADGDGEQVDPDEDGEGLFGSSGGGGLFSSGSDDEGDGGGLLGLSKIFSGDSESATAQGASEPKTGPLEGVSVRPEPVLIEEDANTLSEYQIEKILYMLKRDFVGYERIDGIKHDINVEDVSCDGYDSPVFVYHTDYEQIISNVHHGREELDEFVVKLAQRSGKGISKRQPQVDATLPDGSRAQLTLGREVSDHGTNYTIRQFKDVPFTPIDLINWRTFSLDQMAFLWLAIENHKSLIFAGGTASGKTTSLNAVSLFIPSDTKIVSIEDTREVELPQRNWIASITRPSFSEDAAGDIDEFDLLEAALRQRPDYIVMGEIRGEEGRTLFQVMSTGHTTYTTFHADSVGEVLKRFTTEPINVSKTLFTALDLVSIQTQTRVQGRKVRKSKSITEINEYSAENDEINVQDVYQWIAETDTFDQVGRSNVLDQIMFDRGWDRQKLDDEIFKRRVVLSYLIRNSLNDYAQVAATLQAFMSDPDTILTLLANDALKDSLEELRSMESVLIDIDPEKEELVPRPDPGDEVYELTGEILGEAQGRLFDDYASIDPSDIDIQEVIETEAVVEEDTPEVEEPEEPPEPEPPAVEEEEEPPEQETPQEPVARNGGQAADEGLAGENEQVTEAEASPGGGEEVVDADRDLVDGSQEDTPASTTEVIFGSETEDGGSDEGTDPFEDAVGDDGGGEDDEVRLDGGDE